jgi:hypothetical protein
MACGLLVLAACSAAYMRDPEPGAAPGPEEAKVVIYRPSSSAASRTYPVYDGERLVGFAESGAYFEYRCPAGEHLFLVLGRADAAVRAELAPGRTYYLRVDAKAAWFSRRLLLSPVAPGSPEMERLEDELGGCDPRELVPEEGAEFAEEDRDRAAARKAHYAGDGRGECGQLRPEDGRENPPSKP